MQVSDKAPPLSRPEVRQGRGHSDRDRLQQATDPARPSRNARPTLPDPARGDRARGVEQGGPPCRRRPGQAALQKMMICHSPGFFPSIRFS